MLDAAKQEVGVFAMFRSWQWLGEHVSWIVSTSEPDNRHFCVDVPLDEEVFGFDVTILFHDGLVVSSEFHCLVVYVDRS